jgi:putative hydrolase of the HAD superfamily
MQIGLVADTRDGTYRNVLGIHGLFNLFDVFDVFAVSDQLGVEKPDQRMFIRALEVLGIPEPDWGDVVMVGTNLAREMRGAKAVGLTTVWIVRNQRYPIVCAEDTERPGYQVSTAGDLECLLDVLSAGHDPSAWSHPQPFPWE